MLNPLYESLSDKTYDAQVIVTLPVFRLFSKEAQVGVMAHEFAHAEHADRLGPGWYEKMLSRYADEEKHADRIAVQWGFGDHIKALRSERHEIVNPLLDSRTRRILRRLHKADEASRNAMLARMRAAGIDEAELDNLI